MSANPLPSPAYLRQRLRYEPDTGKLYWLPYPGMRPSWVTRWGGKEAFITTHRQGYLIGRIDGSYYFAHRVAWALHHGAWPSDQIDHVNHDQKDNRLSNLRVVSKLDNMRNMPRLKNNTSGVTGVWFDKRISAWIAFIRVNRKLIRLGTFRVFGDAVAVRRTAETEFGFHANHGR